MIAPSPPSAAMLFRQLFDLESSTYTYLLADPASGEAVLIDPVLEQIERDLELVRDLELRLVHVLDTHVHADHVTAAGTIRARTGARTVVSERTGVGSADVYVKEGDRVRFGACALEVRETPGHTAGCVTFVAEGHDRAFTGDTLLVRGTGRTDFQGGDARALHRSITGRILTLPDGCLLYPAHDYRGRTVTTVAEEKRLNPRVAGKSEDELVAIMSALHLAYPKKIDVAVPANLHGGLPRPSPPDVARDWAPVELSAGDVPEVPPSWVAANVGAARLVDVREAEELSGELGHVPGVLHVPLATIASASAGWDREAPVITICRSGGRSGRAALELRALGVTRAASMRGGMAAWVAEGLPVSRGAASRTDSIQG